MAEWGCWLDCNPSKNFSLVSPAQHNPWPLKLPCRWSPPPSSCTFDNAKDIENLHFLLQAFWNILAARRQVHSDTSLRQPVFIPHFHQRHQELQAAPGEPGCSLPKVVLALMIWSDTTYLTSFGEAKLCPCYLQFRNKSKHSHYHQQFQCYPSPSSSRLSPSIFDHYRWCGHKLHSWKKHLWAVP